MAIQSAESNRALLRYIPEAVWGTTPTSGKSREMRITSSSLVLNKETAISEEIRADRMVPNIAEVAASSGGDINWELSAFTHDDFFQAFLLGLWSLPMNGWQVKGAQVSVTGVSTITVAGADWRDWLAVNQWLKLEGFRNPANNLYVSVASLAFTGGNTVITVNQNTMVAESGTAYSKVMDAGDVILASTTTSIEAGNKINGGGANAFAGKTLYIGQKIYIEGLGKETATLTYDPPAAVAGNTLTVSDGEQTVIFELNTTEDAIDPSRVFVALAGDVRANLTAALMEQFVRGNIRVSGKNGVGTKEAGSIAFATTAEVGDQWTVDDGVTSLSFVFVASGGTGLSVNVGASATDSAANLAAAINASALNVTATPSTGTVNIVNDNYTGGAITEDVDTGTDVTTTNFAGGVAPTSILTNHRQVGGSLGETGTVFTVGSFSGGSATKAGFYTIASLPDDDSIVVTETLTADANGGSLPVVIKGSHLRNPGNVGAITKQSFTIETGFTDVSRYFKHDGMRVGTFDMSVTTGEIVTGSFSFMGSRTIPSIASVLGDPVAYDVLPTTATEILNATANVGQIEKNGVPLATAVRSIEMSGDASLRNQPAVGEKFPAGIAYGRFTLEGTITAYFETLDFYNDFRNHETVSLGFDFEDVDHNKYFFRIPAVKITSDPVAPGGIDQDIQEEMEWTAQRDPVLNTQFMIDRFSSVYPVTG
jgi:hypothetical protein